MRNARVWQKALGLTRTVIESVDLDETGEVLVVSVRPRKGANRRCGRCGRRAAWYDRGEGRRGWHALDVGTMRVQLEADAPRVACPVHGPTVIQFPWARHNAGHTRDFDATVAWLAVNASKSAVSKLMRIAWKTVGSILARVGADIDASVDRLAGLRRIGVDEISYKRGHKYLTVVVDHDTGALVWAAPGKDSATLEAFFDALGEARCAQITDVTCDAAQWFIHVIDRRCPNAKRSTDPFHVVMWATDALDEVRRQVWNEARGGTNTSGSSRKVARKYQSNPLKRARWALWKNPEDLTVHQRHQLDWIAASHPRLWRAYMLKEALRYVFAVKGDEGREALDRWLAWASRSRLTPFVELARRIRRHRSGIETALDTGLSNGLIESTNTKIRLLTRIAFGFHGPEPLIALIMLALGNPRPALPGRE